MQLLILVRPRVFGAFFARHCCDL